MKITGTGSTLILLVFSALCLTILSLISLSAAGNDKAAAEARARTVKGYYEADLQAEYILAEIISKGELPESAEGIDVLPVDGGAAFACPISDNKELYVEFAANGDSVDILCWRIRDTDEWVIDDTLPVWSGD